MQRNKHIRVTRRRIKTLIQTSALLAASLGLNTNRVEAASFAAGNIVIYRVGGDAANNPGAAALTGAATPVFLDEYTPAGVLVQSVALPTAGSGTNRALTATGNSTTEGFLSRSLNGQYLIVPGFDAVPGTISGTSLAATTSAAVPRVIGRVDNAGTINTSTTTTSFNTGNIRSATSPDGTNLFATGSNTGVVYTTLGASGAGTLVSNTFTNLRQINIFQDVDDASFQLYVSAGASTLRLGQVGEDVPTTTGQTIVGLPGFPTTTPTISNGYVILDLNPLVDGADTLYVADEASAATGGGIQKYSRTVTGGTFALNGNLTNVPSRGLTGVASGNTITLYAVTTINTLVTTTDTTGNGGAVTVSPATTLATAAANTAFRGVAFAPNVASAVQLIDFNAKRYTDGSFVQWRTGLETNNLGFWLYRQDRLTQANGKMAWSRPYRLNPSLIAGAALQNNANATPEGGFLYGWRDTRPLPRSGVVRYWLQDVETGGHITTHGPAQPLPARGSLSALKTSPMVTQLAGR